MTDLADYQAQLNACQILIQKGKWPQSTIFVISQRLNTTELATFIMRQLLCQHDAQDQCSSCALQLHSHPDIRWLERPEDETTLSLELVKQSIQHLYQSPFISQKKILFIPQAESLSTEAANALLKPIEDYKQDRHLVLFTTDQQRLLSTVRSRSVLFYLPAKLRPGTEEVSNPLEIDLHALPQAILSRSPERFQLTERIHKAAADLPPSQVRRLLTEQATEWQNIFLQEHRTAQPAAKKQQLRKLAQLCEKLPLQLQQHVSLKSALDILITCV